MRAPDLRRLDQRVVPVAARRLRAALDRAAAIRRRRSDRPAGALARIDQRFASSGPLRYARDVPQVALLVVAAVFAAGAVAAASLHDPPATQPAPSAAATGRVPLGALPGEDVTGHLATARTSLAQTASRTPGARLVALVDLTSYQPVSAVATLAADVVVRSVYLRAPAVEGAEVLTTGATGQSDLAALCTSTATRRAADAAELRNLASTVDATTPVLQQQKDDLGKEAVRSDAEAVAYGGACRTVLAVLVEGPASALQGLMGREAVRGVEPARAGATVAELDVHPLLPETTGTAPATSP